MKNPNPRIYLSPPHMSGNERDLLLEAFDSNWIAPLGPHVDQFEKEFALEVGAPYAVALASGTAALHLALRLKGVGVGDEVLTSTFTFVATANAIKYCGAEPVFIDSDRPTWNMDPQLLEDELSECRKRNQLPKAVLVVDVIGQCADYRAISQICADFEVPLIEDAAEALGAKYHSRPSGSFGAAACFSFNGNKIITTSGGGMLVTHDRELAEQARYLSTQARDPVVHYQHSQVGYNYRLSNLLAAVGRGQLKTLDEKVKCRRAHFEFYRNQLQDLPGIEFMPEPKGYFSTRWLTAITVDPQHFGTDYEAIRLALEAENIESRPVWKPMHLQPVFLNNRSRLSGVSDSIFQIGLCLPSGSSLVAEELERIVSVVRGCRSGKTQGGVSQ